MSIINSIRKETTIDHHGVYGLNERDAQKIFRRNGPNAITLGKRISVIKILISQFKDFMVLILLGSMIISFFMGEVTEAITIVSIVIINAILGFVQEFKTEKTMEALKNLVAPMARVIRGGKVLDIDVKEIVIGDLILLEPGDKVPADAVLIEANTFQLDESLLTGESAPISKSPDDGGDKKNMIYMGTIVSSGRAKAIVVSTGMKTEMGKIADMIQEIGEEDTPLQKRLKDLGRYIVYGCLAVCSIVVLIGIMRGEDIFTMLLAGISLAVAAVPEGLPAIVTVALALGVQRMLKKNCIVRKLPAVETLGCANIICSDKTGTLTQNEMYVKKIYFELEIFEEEEWKKKQVVNISGNPLLKIFELCNNAKIRESVSDKFISKLKSVTGKREVDIMGEPTEVALLRFVQLVKTNRENIGLRWERKDEIPFDSSRKCMSVICTNSMGETNVFSKGAPDVLLKKCNKIYTKDGIINLTDSLRMGVIKTCEKMANDALRVIGASYKKLEFKDRENRQEYEKDMIFVGLVGMIDPPKKDALEAVRKCKIAGVKPIMITGDHKLTAMAIAKELEIFKNGDLVLTGSEIERMRECDLERIIDKVTIYARVLPKHKLLIVRLLKKKGNIVAMTGDGVNDAPAVKEADIGVSMGKCGTDVTRESSSMILLDDNFATIVSAVEEGRVIYGNIRKFIRYLLSCNIGEVLIMFLGMLLGLPLPLLPIQILWVNLATDGLPAIALGLEPPDGDVMLRRPRGVNEGIFSQGLASLILFRGTLIGISTLAVFMSVLYFRNDVDLARTSGFLALVITQLIHVFECKSERKSIFEISFSNNKYLILAVMCSVIMIVSVIYVPFLQSIFKTTPLFLSEWMIVIGFSMIGPVISSIFKVNR